MFLEAGQVFASDYRIVRNLSAGGMGSVFVVEQISTGAQRALKLMHPQLVADVRLRERFLQEARVGSRIASDHVVQVLAAGIETQANVPWLVMELLQGEELRKRVDRTGPIPWAEACEIARQLGHALQAAHRVGIVHRDLKPDNIFLAQSRVSGTPFTVKVLDFGIAKVLAEAQTTGTSGLGTPLWMAPEQAELKSQVDGRTDIWATGLVFYYVLTGKNYWASANTASPSLQSLMRELLLEPIGAPSARAHERGHAHLLPPGFDQWFAGCVERDLARRFPTVEMAFGALIELLSRPQPHSSQLAPPMAMHRSQDAAEMRHPPTVQRTDWPPGPAYAEPARTYSATGHTPPVAFQQASDTQHAAPQKRSGIALLVATVLLVVAGLGLWAVMAQRHDRQDASERPKKKRRAVSEEECDALESLFARHRALHNLDQRTPEDLVSHLPELNEVALELRGLSINDPQLERWVSKLADHASGAATSLTGFVEAQARGNGKAAEAAEAEVGAHTYKFDEFSDNIAEACEIDAPGSSG